MTDKYDKNKAHIIKYRNNNREKWNTIRRANYLKNKDKINNLNKKKQYENYTIHFVKKLYKDDEWYYGY